MILLSLQFPSISFLKFAAFRKYNGSGTPFPIHSHFHWYLTSHNRVEPDLQWKLQIRLTQRCHFVGQASQYHAGSSVFRVQLCVQELLTILVKNRWTSQEHKTQTAAEGKRKKAEVCGNAQMPNLNFLMWENCSNNTDKRKEFYTRSEGLTKQWYFSWQKSLNFGGMEYLYVSGGLKSVYVRLGEGPELHFSSRTGRGCRKGWLKFILQFEHANGF